MVVVTIILATSWSWSPSLLLFHSCDYHHCFYFVVMITIAITLWSWSPLLLLLPSHGHHHCYYFLVMVTLRHQLLLRYLHHRCCLLSDCVCLMPLLLLFFLLRQGTSPFPFLYRCGMPVGLSSNHIHLGKFYFSMLIFFLFFLFLVFLLVLGCFFLFFACLCLLPKTQYVFFFLDVGFF